MGLAVSPELLERYATSAPRYTSYPTAVDWTREFEPATYPELLTRAAAKDEPLSLYLHVPYCAEMCLFCGCNVTITRSRERVATYIEHVEREVESIAASGIGRRPVRQYHWGGGTPTHLELEEIERVQRAIGGAFGLAPDAEASVEVDPRVTTPAQIELFARLGFNRISMGVQDFDPKVQRHVKRVQSEEATREIVAAARGAGMGSLNIDLIYGLPHQSLEGFARTLDAVLDIRPERVALFHYAHVPWIKKHQEALDTGAIPAAAQKIEIFLDALSRFRDAGYDALGLDHFALPDDELSQAAREGTLGRNFMGYTTRRGSDMVSLGVSAIGEVSDTFVQNDAAEPRYLERVRDQGFATFRGHTLTREDRLRRDVIMALMCNGRIDKRRIEAQHGIEFDATFATELSALEPMQTDGFIELGQDSLAVTELGRLFLRNLALPFDRYLAERRASRGGGADDERTFSKTL